MALGMCYLSAEPGGRQRPENAVISQLILPCAFSLTHAMAGFGGVQVSGVEVEGEGASPLPRGALTYSHTYAYTDSRIHA